MNYLITYETQGVSAYPKSIIIHDIPQWLKDNPNSYIIVCQSINEFKIKKSDLIESLDRLNKR